MTPEEALQYQRSGGRLYEPITLERLVNFDCHRYFRERGTVVVMTSIPATNPGHEHGVSPEQFQQALAFSRAGRIIQKVL